MDLKGKIRTVPHFPKQGVMFRDITTLLKDADGFNHAIDEFVKRYRTAKIDKVVGIESRGFIFGSAVAHRLNVGFVPARKPGKLPHKRIREEYDLEYGKDALEIHEDSIIKNDNVLIVDDLIATGGSSLAAIKLVEKLGGKVAECAFVIGLPELNGIKKLTENGYTVFTLVDFEGE